MYQKWKELEKNGFNFSPMKQKTLVKELGSNRGFLKLPVRPLVLILRLLPGADARQT